MPRCRPAPLGDEVEFEVVVKNTFLEVSDGTARLETSPSAWCSTRHMLSCGLSTAPASLTGGVRHSLSEAAASASAPARRAERSSARTGKAVPREPAAQSDGEETETTAPSTPSQESICLWPATPATPTAPVQISLAELTEAEAWEGYFSAVGAMPQQPELPMASAMYHQCWEWDFGPMFTSMLPPPPGSPTLPPQVWSTMPESVPSEYVSATQLFSYVTASAPVPKCTPPCAPPCMPEAAAEVEHTAPPGYEAASGVVSC